MGKTAAELMAELEKNTEFQAKKMPEISIFLIWKQGMPMMKGHWLKS